MSTGSYNFCCALNCFPGTTATAVVRFRTAEGLAGIDEEVVAPVQGVADGFWLVLREALLVERNHIEGAILVVCSAFHQMLENVSITISFLAWNKIVLRENITIF